ncbi:unnamed protein product [marine sediment metagenome]|uniref:TAXI family TRAP transporter solute-binding subunit n=1 Tax=marine sediment metagenome TaxID=412755 RepID=X1RDM0_9ZZZZ
MIKDRKETEEMNLMKKFLVGVVVCLLVLSLGVTGYAISLKATAGGVGGVWYTTLAGIAEIVHEQCPDITIRVVPGGGLINQPRVGTGEAELGFTFPPQAFAARHGNDPFSEKYPDIRLICTGLGYSYLTFVVAEETGITSIEEIVQRKYPLKLAVERRGTTDEWGCRKVLEYYGVTFEDIEKWGGKVYHAGYGDQATLFKDRHVDAIFENIAIPASAIMEAKIARRIRLLPFPKGLVDYLHETYAFARGKIPEGSYGVVGWDYPSLSSSGTIMVNKNVPEDVVYKITKALLENADRVHAIHASCESFVPEVAWKDVGGPLHPGAERAYKEKGYMK